LDVRKRTADDSRKISSKQRAELIILLITETAEFHKHLKQPYRGMIINVLMKQQVSTAQSGSAAEKSVSPENVIYVVGFSTSGSTTTNAAPETYSTGVLVGKVDNSPP
jgi:hypothetical protein